MKFNVSHKIVGVIPARYGSTRLPGKPLIKINEKPMIQHVWERASKSMYLNLIIVATDDKRIFNTVTDFGGEAVMTSGSCKSGTLRVYEAVKKMNCDIVVNIQGDEPFINSRSIDMAIKPVLIDKKINVSTLCYEINNRKEIENPNIVKVIFDKYHDAIYFSRNAIPYKRDKSTNVKYYKHIGLYVYRKIFLPAYLNMKNSKLEEAEKLEQLRILENSGKIKVVETKYDSISIDTKNDLRKILNKK